MGKYEKYEYHLMIGILCLSALLGIGIGYLVFGPLHATAIINEQEGTYYSNDYQLAGLMYDTPVFHYSLEQSNHYTAELERLEELEVSNETHSFILTSYDGYVVILYSEPDGKAEWQILEMTTTPVGGLPVEEQERLIVGIPVYTQEELIRILQDYES